MDATQPIRIDPPGPIVSGPASTRKPPHRATLTMAGGNLEKNPRRAERGGSPQQKRRQWLDLQAEDLIERLQQWAVDLDAREAQLNVQASLQDRRERQFRLRQQDAMAQLAEQQRSIARQQHEIECRARRLAFQDR